MVNCYISLLVLIIFPSASSRAGAVMFLIYNAVTHYSFIAIKTIFMLKFRCKVRKDSKGSFLYIMAFSVGAGPLGIKQVCHSIKGSGLSKEIASDSQDNLSLHFAISIFLVSYFLLLNYVKVTCVNK